MKRSLFLCMIAVASVAQAAYHSGRPSIIHQMELSLRGGLSGLTYQSDFGNLAPSGNTGLDIAYILMGQYVGFRFGVAFDYSTSRYVAKDYSDQYSAINVQGSQIDISYNMMFSESHRQTYVSVPLQLGIGVGDWRLFVGPEIKYGLTARFKQSIEHASVDVYYPEYDVMIYEALAYDTHIKGNEWKGQIADFQKFWYGLAAETDYQFDIPGRSGNRIGVGAYFDFGFNSFSVMPTENMTLLRLTDTADGLPVSRVFTSALEANHHQSGGQQLIRSFRYFDCGVKLSFLLTRQTSVHSIRRCKVCPRDY